MRQRLGLVARVMLRATMLVLGALAAWGLGELADGNAAQAADKGVVVDTPRLSLGSRKPEAAPHPIPPPRPRKSRHHITLVAEQPTTTQGTDSTTASAASKTSPRKLAVPRPVGITTAATDDISAAPAAVATRPTPRPWLMPVQAVSPAAVPAVPPCTVRPDTPEQQRVNGERRRPQTGPPCPQPAGPEADGATTVAPVAAPSSAPTVLPTSHDSGRRVLPADDPAPDGRWPHITPRPA